VQGEGHPERGWPSAPVSLFSYHMLKMDAELLKLKKFRK